MADINITQELRDALMKAESVQEVRDILAASGQEFAEEDAKRVWQEVEHHGVDYVQELSEDELDAVAGGITDRNWAKDGCAATVEYSSCCWSNDACAIFEVRYSNTWGFPK